MFSIPRCSCFIICRSTQLYSAITLSPRNGQAMNKGIVNNLARGFQHWWICYYSFAIFFVKQGNQSVLQSSHNYQHPQMPSVRPGPFQYNHNQAQLNMNAPPAYSTQPTQSNPCSGLVSFVINMPSYIFRDTSLSAVNVTVQPVHPSQQDPAGEPVRGAEQVQTVVVGGAQQNLPTSTWERVQ